jgi:hypothetical protein
VGLPSDQWRAPPSKKDLFRGPLARQRRQPVHNGAQTDKHDRQLEQECQPAVGDEALDRPETDCADDHDAQYSDKNRKNRNDYPFRLRPLTLEADICQLQVLQFLVQRYSEHADQGGAPWVIFPAVSISPSISAPAGSPSAVWLRLRHLRKHAPYEIGIANKRCVASIDVGLRGLACGRPDLPQRAGSARCRI